MVIHAAAQIGQHSNRELQTRVNVDGTKNVVVASKKYQVKRLLYVSSIATIGIPFSPNSPADETFPFSLEKHCSSYLISKRQSEEEVLKECTNGLDAVIVNPAWIFGPFWSSFRGGELIDKVERNLIVPYFFGGICAVHVNDVVNGILNALKQGRKGERYILGGENLSYRLIAEIAADCLGLKRIFIPVPSFVTGTMAKIFEMVNKFSGKRPYLTFDEHRYVNRYHYYDSSKAMKELQYQYRPFKKIVEDYIEYKRIKNTP
jgi:dihydroflavonol-4-reductase